MKIFKNFVPVLIVILLMTVGFWKLKTQNSNSATLNERVVQTYKATLEIKVDSTKQDFDITQQIGKTALEATQIALDGKVITSGTGSNSFVLGIAGRTADTKKHEFWKLVINGKDSEVGAGSYKIQNNDSVVWQIDNY